MKNTKLFAVAEYIIKVMLEGETGKLKDIDVLKTLNVYLAPFGMTLGASCGY